MYSKNIRNNKMKKAFNPDDFFTTVTVKDILPKFEQLKGMDFKKVSLNEELTRLNYEVVSKEYSDFEFSDVEEYGDFIVDTIV